jgi:hypothetical protein
MTKEEKLLAETRKRMQQLYEYQFYNSLDEEGEDQNTMPPAGGAVPAPDPNAAAPAGADPMMGDGQNAMPPAGADPMMGGDPNAGVDPMMGGDPNAGVDPMMGGDPNAGGINGANLAPNAGMEGGDPNAMGDPMMGDMGAQPGPDDNVVDITQLTDAQDELKANQEQTTEQLEDVDAKLSTLLKVVDKFTSALDANDAKIAELKSELIKRTPTEEETMNVRLNAGGNPFDQKPEEFWDKFQDINNHYNITSNNEAPQYQIRKSDIDNVNDKMISDELDDIPRSLHEYFVR